MLQRRVGPMVLIVLGFVALFVIIFALMPAPSGPKGTAMASDIGVRTPAGPVKLSDLKGKVVILDFWATWCGPCRMSIPGIQRLYEKYKSKGLEVLGISKDSEDGPAIQQFIKELGMTYPAGMPLSQESLTPYATASIPSAFIVDKKGLIQWAQEGYSQGIEADMEATVERLLKE